MVNRITVMPSAKRLMESLRDIGYELPSAVADLVDNSLDGRAKRVDIRVAFEGADSWIRITDDGGGIPTSRLNEAMRYGAAAIEESRLGRFGLGLKTASLSQCRRLTVATRTSPTRRAIEVRRWDLDVVDRSDRWEVLRLSPGECRPEVTEELREHTGTVVFWESLDRVLSFRRPSGQAAEHALLGRTCREIEDYVAMVFHRFLAGEIPRRARVRMSINGSAIPPWDPFARDEPKTKVLPERLMTLSDGDSVHEIRVQPFVLPNQSQFSSFTSFDRAAGPQRWNRQQGFYIYRENRLIQSGGWNRLRTQDEHTKLARVAVDIPRDADALFKINVSKMRVTLPAEIRDRMRAVAAEATAEAQRAYRSTGPGRSPRGSTGRGSPGGPSGDGSTGRSGRTNGGGNGRPVPENELWARLEAALRREFAGDTRTLQRVIGVLRPILASAGRVTGGG